MVIWTEPAKADLRHIHDYIAEDSKRYAHKVVRDIVDKADILNDLPKFGRMVPELKYDNLREFPLYSYRIIYEVTDTHIFVLAVVHKRRDFKEADLNKY